VSIGGFLKRRLGKEVAENIAEPLLSGIYAGDTDVLSLQATFPQFQELEKKYGSLIQGMTQMQKARITADQNQSSVIPEHARGSLFLTFRQGLQTLVTKMLGQMSAVDLRTNQQIQAIEHRQNHYLIHLEKESIPAEALIIATPAYQTAKLIPAIDSLQSLMEIPYVSVANIILCYNQGMIPRELDASGFVIPRKAQKTITACTWTSAKWPHSSRKDQVLLRCYVGHAKDQRSVELPDEQLLQRVQDDLREIMGITAAPSFHRITRLRQSMPQYTINHLQKVSVIREQLKKQLPGISIAGAAYYGVGIPDCVAQGKQASEEILTYLQERNH
jgi:oxygen-dependent protoporphyrinogen oxidase